MANGRYNVDGGLNAQVFLVNPMRFFGDASRALRQHAKALLYSFPNDSGCEESADTISEAAGTLLYISKQLPARLVTFVYLASSFAARDHYSWLSLVVLDNVRRKIGNYLPTIQYCQQFHSALECNTVVLTGRGPDLPEDKDPAENIRMYVDFVLRAINELEREPFRLLFNAPGQVIFSIQEFLSLTGRPAPHSTGLQTQMM
ncbi:hypothetical protein EV426DRAFT_573097 [Tirmania nivea]|nr:hypothetical protein EV426DRAFT_573097 [Tirmania nivea]